MYEIESQPDFPLNQELLTEAKQAVQEWKSLQDRLQRISESKDSLSAVVFERVMSDYQARKNEAKEKLLSFKAELDRELQTHEVTENKLSQRIEEHRHTLEEIEFRNTLGEFSAADYKSKSKQEKDKLQKLEGLLAAVKRNIEHYQAIFAGSEILLAEPATIDILAQVPTRTKKVERDTLESLGKLSISSTQDAEEPLTDEAGYIVEEQNADYFSGLESEEKTPHFSEDLKTDVKTEITRPASTAKLVIINGKDAGQTFKLKDITSLGRADNNTVPLRDNKASRQHSKIQRKGKEYVIVDLNSSNGTYVNGERIEEYVLSNGDEVQIGDSILQFQAS